MSYLLALMLYRLDSFSRNLRFFLRCLNLAGRECQALLERCSGFARSLSYNLVFSLCRDKQLCEVSFVSVCNADSLLLTFNEIGDRS